MADSTVNQTIGFGSEVKPYAERMLATAEQASLRPYESYAGGDVGARVAQFNPLQQQAFGSAASMAPSAITGQAATGLQGIAERAGYFDQFVAGRNRHDRTFRVHRGIGRRAGPGFAENCQ